jgi:threonine/homoserine/homoserine lactone efflux protein
MTQDIALALVFFAAATLYTPGPNNLMLVASGANFGLRRSLPHAAGVAWGYPLMIIPVGLGVMQIFDLWPTAFTVLKAVAVVYMLYLAWKIANAGEIKEASSEARPLTLAQAAAFQWVNPKGWSMALGAITLYAPGRSLTDILWVAATFAILGTGSALLWTTLGTGIRRWLSRPARRVWFNRAMAALLIASMTPVLLTSGA